MPEQSWHVDVSFTEALSHLSHLLLEGAAERIEGFEGHPVEVHE